MSVVCYPEERLIDCITFIESNDISKVRVQRVSNAKNFTEIP